MVIVIILNFPSNFRKEVKVYLHPSSTVGDFPRSPRTTSAQARSAIVESLPCDWMIYEEMSRTGRFCHVRTVTLVNPISVVLFSGPARLPMDVINEAESKTSFFFISILY